MGSIEQDPEKSVFRTPVAFITSHNAEGKAKVHTTNDEPSLIYPGMRVFAKLGYTTSSFPADLNNELDIKQHNEHAASGKRDIVKAGGTICRWVDFAPGHKVMMHRTQSLDYGVVLEGKILMLLDDGSETLMQAGDLAVQRATMHAWRNPSDTEWARMMFVLQDCKPLLVGGERFKEDLGNGTDVFPSSGNDE